MTFIIKKSGAIHNSKLRDSILSGDIYTQRNNNWGTHSFSPQIFETSTINVVLSKEIYDSYLRLLDFSTYISKDKLIGVCELPFIWLGEKKVINGIETIEIRENVKIPFDVNLPNEMHADLDYEKIIKFLESENQFPGLRLKSPHEDIVISFERSGNAHTRGGLVHRDDIKDLLKDEQLQKYNNLVIIAGHTHPIMTAKSNNGFSPSPIGTNPTDFGLGIRGTNFSYGDMDVWAGLINVEDFDIDKHFLAANICALDGNLHLLSYEGSDPKMIRNISVDNNPDVKIPTSKYNSKARRNYLTYTKTNTISIL